jgi:cephalosporin-C deacetylase-like acetyl esterase
MNRRKFILESGASLLCPALLRTRDLAQALVPQEPTRSYAEEMPNMLESYLTANLNRLASTWDQRRAQLRTATDLQARNTTVRENLLHMLGAFPQKSPLQSNTVHVIEGDGYRVESVMFCSRPDFWVTANLYLPTSGKGPFPAIISPCGHYPLARMLPQYQSAYISLVKSGFIVLSYDPIGQGERREYWNPSTNITDVGGPVFEHSMAGQQLLLLGDTLTGYLVWDGIRAIDYLLTRREADPGRIGCAGHSGGGTLTKFLAIADDRIRCAAVLEGGTANMWPERSIGVADVEQNLFPAALYGVDNVDLHAAIAPRPLLAGIEHESAEFDKAAHAIRARYRQLGAEDKFATIVSDDPHAWTPRLRLATTDWFCRWFYDRDGPLEESFHDTRPPEDLFCTSDGSLRYSRKGLTLSSLISAKEADLRRVRQAGAPSAHEPAAQKRETRKKLTNLLRYQRHQCPLGVRLLTTTPREGYQVQKIEFLSEPGIYIPAWVFVPRSAKHRPPTILYFTDEGIQSDGMEFAGAEGAGIMHGILDQLARKGYLIIAVDVRGIGQTSQSSSSSSLSFGEFGQLFNGDTAMAYAAWSTDQSLLGMRVQDVVRSVDYVLQRDDADLENLHVIGKGRAGLWCLYAAALDERIPNLICVQSLLSYQSLTEVDRYLYGADIFIPDILRDLDLPDVAATVAPRSLMLIDPKDAMKQTVDSAHANDVYQGTREVFEAAGAGKRFRIENQGAGMNLTDLYLSQLTRAQSDLGSNQLATNSAVPAHANQRFCSPSRGEN